jgi:hypothetical protein
MGPGHWFIMIEKMINNIETTWLTTSLFAARNDWPLLVNEGIKPLLDKLTLQRKIVDTEISINDFLGDNIRFALLINKEFAGIVAEELHIHFTLLLASCAPAPVNEIGSPETLFCSFHNTVRYRLYDSPVPNDLKPVHKEIERIILDTLPENGFTDEDLLMVCFYLHLGLTRALRQHTEENESMARYYNYSFNNKTGAFLQPMLEENKEQLEKIAIEIFGKDVVVNPDVTWILNWISTCEKMIKYQMETNNNLSLQHIHERITAAIDKQLNVSLYVKSVLVYFLIHIFNQLKV